MDLTVDITPTLGPAKDYIVAFGHLKLVRDRSNNDKNKTVPSEVKKSTTSKLPRNTHSTTSSKKITPKSSGQSNTSGDTATTSNQINPKITVERSGEDKCKPSLIPRRKSNSKETPTRENTAVSMKSTTNRMKPKIQQRNVQRVQLLNINPEFFREIRSPPKSVTSARPIPTLGHIYRQDISSDTFTDWFLESVDEHREPFYHSIEIASTATDNSATNCVSANNNEMNNFNTTTITNLPTVKDIPTPLKTFKTTNENVSEWLSTELDHPTKDNESGYRSISPMSKTSITTAYKNTPCGSKMTDEKYSTHNILKQSSSTKIPPKESVSDIFLSTQPTVVIKKKKENNSSASLFAIPKINTDIKQNDYYPDFHKPLKYLSTPNPPRKREAIDKYPAASYVEYPSEVLQKTTNFETDGCENLSSVIETDRGNLSSQWTLRRNMDSNSTFNCLDWSKLHSSQETFKKISTSGSWRSNGLDDKQKYSYHDYCYHYCWRKEVAKKDMDESPWDYRGRCKRCHKYRRTPNRKKLGQPFRYLRKRMTIGVCRHRLNRVWKKTTEKWANWSKSPSKLRRFRTMNYLQKSILWDNANVQTTVFVYHEAGTDAVAREQKSAEITASPSCRHEPSEISDSSVRTRAKHANIGPSMFPFLRYSTNNTLVLGRTSFQSKPSSGNDIYNKGAKVKEIRSINTQYSNTQKNSCEEDSVFDISPVERQGVRKMIDLSSMKLKQAVSQDAYTQAVIMCHNADTNIMFTPTITNHPQKSPLFSQDLLYYGVDAATDPITIDKISHRSVNVMTSKGILQEMVHNETQVSPSVSIRNVSTGILATETYQDAKSSVITDTTVPCRRLDNTVVTCKGTILSCTGTKITSVSSADLQRVSTISRISRPVTVNLAVSTFANTRRKDSSTAPSLYRPQLKEVALETETFEVAKSEKSTSQIHIENYADVGVSASGVVERTSFNCGSHVSQCSFGADILSTATQPDYISADMNTDVQLVSECTSVDPDLRNSRNKSVNSCQTQYSSYYKDDSWSPVEGTRMRIGRSRLLSVRALLPDAAEDGAQAQPSRHSAETKTTSHQKMSASVLTSRYGFGDRLVPIEMTLDADQVLALNRALVRSDNEAAAGNMPPVGDEVSSKMSQPSKHPSTCSKQRIRVKSRSPKVLISSHLNASKWINECVNKEQDVHSILTASASAVSESLHRAALVARSTDTLTAPEIHQLSKVLVKSHAAINCVSAKSTSFGKKMSRKENANESVINERRSPKLTADKVTSDEVLVKDVKESILQVQPNLCETATVCDIFDHKAASVLTSRDVLPKNVCCGRRRDGRNDTDCLFVYDRPRCVIHNYCVDVAVQLQPAPEEKFHNKRSSSQRSIGIASSMPCQDCCHRKSEVTGEVLSPRVYKALYDTAKLVMKERSESRSSKNSSNESTSGKTEIEDLNKMTSQITSCQGIPPAQCCCMRCTQIGHTDNRSIQAVKDSIPRCPNCNTKIAELPTFDSDIKRHLAPAAEEAVLAQNLYKEAYSMNPSGKHDEDCEAKITTHKINNTLNSSCILSPVISAIDLRGDDKQDLQTVYYILSAIEGRVRRLKSRMES